MAKNYTVLWGIVMMTAIISVLCALTLTDWGSWFAIIAGAIVFIGGAVILCGFLKKIYRQSVLFIPKRKLSEIYTSGAIQRVQYALQMKLNTQVESIIILFNGTGIRPQIQELDDWQGKEKGNLYVVHLDNQDIDSWQWNYRMPRHRHQGSFITIAIDFLANDVFNGYIEFQMTTADAQKVRRLPFRVLEGRKDPTLQNV
jgi:hypothetical protein